MKRLQSINQASLAPGPAGCHPDVHEIRSALLKLLDLIASRVVERLQQIEKDQPNSQCDGQTKEALNGLHKVHATDQHG
jgi:hypothetical protein